MSGPINFTPEDWQDGPTGGTPITAEELNRDETAIGAVVTGVDAIDTITGIVKGTGAGVALAVPGVDYQLPLADTAPITSNTSPTALSTTVYNATAGALSVALPALSGLSVGVSYGVQKASSQIDSSSNAITFTAAGSDTFDSGSTTSVLAVSGELRVLQVVSISGTKYWKVADGNTPLGSMDTRYIPGVYSVKNYGAKGNAVVTTGSISSATGALTKTSGSFLATDVGKTVIIPNAGTTRSVANGAITTGTTTLTSSTAAFTSADVRSTVAVTGAGVSAAALVATITEVLSATQVTLSVAASTTVSSAATTISAYLSVTILSVASGVATISTNALHSITAGTFIYGTDDTAAINAAIAAAVGGRVFIPAGNYLVSSPLIPQNNVAVVGAGTGATRIYGVGTSGFPIFLQSSLITTFASASQNSTLAAPLTDFTLADLTIDGLYMQTAYYVNNNGVRVQFQAHCTYRDLVIQNTLETGLAADYPTKGTTIHNVRALMCGAGSLNGVSGSGGGGIGVGTGASALEEFVISDCHAYGNGTYGIFIETETTSVWSVGGRVVGCFAAANKTGFGDSGGQGVIWSGCVAYQNAQDGFAVDIGTTSTAAPGQDTLLVDCVAYLNGRHGFSYSNTTTQYNAVARITWAACKAFSNVSNGFAIIPAGPSSGNLDCFMLDSCEAYLNGASGFILFGTGPTVRQLIITGGAYYANGQTSGTDHYGLRLNSTAAEVAIRGVKAFDNGGTQKQTHGLMTLTGVTITDLTVEGCDFSGNLTAACSLAATLAGTPRFRNVAGYNPVGSGVPGTAFALPATTVAWTNLTGVDVTLYVTAVGTVTVVTVNGVVVSGGWALGNAYRVVAGGTFKLTYSAAPTVIAIGD